MSKQKQNKPLPKIDAESQEQSSTFSFYDPEEVRAQEAAERAAIQEATRTPRQNREPEEEKEEILSPDEERAKNEVKAREEQRKELERYKKAANGQEEISTEELSKKFSALEEKQENISRLESEATVTTDNTTKGKASGEEQQQETAQQAEQKEASRQSRRGLNLFGRKKSQRTTNSSAIEKEALLDDKSVSSDALDNVVSDDFDKFVIERNNSQSSDKDGKESSKKEPSGRWNILRRKNKSLTEQAQLPQGQDIEIPEFATFDTPEQEDRQPQLSRQNSNASSEQEVAVQAVTTEDNTLDPNRSRYQKTLDWANNRRDGADDKHNGLARLRRPGSDEIGIGNGALIKTIPSAAINTTDAVLRGTAIALAAAAIAPVALAESLAAGLNYGLDKAKNLQNRIKGNDVDNAAERGEAFAVTKGLAETIRNQAPKAAAAGGRAIGTTVAGGVAAAGVGVGTGVAAGVAGAGVGAAVGIVGAGVGVAAGVAATTATVTAGAAATAVTTSAVAGAVTRTAVDGPKGLVTGTKDGADQAIKALKGQNKRGESQNPERTTRAGKIFQAIGNALKAPFKGTFNAAVEGATKEIANEKKDIENYKVYENVRNKGVDASDDKAIGQAIRESRKELKSSLTKAKNVATAANAFQEAGADASARREQQEFTPNFAEADTGFVPTKPTYAEIPPAKISAALEKEGIFAKLREDSVRLNGNKKLTELTLPEAPTTQLPEPQATSRITKRSDSFGEQALQDKANRTPDTVAL